MTRQHGLLIALVCMTPAGTLLAHDFWIEPAPFVTAIDTVVQVQIRVGEHFSGQPVPRDAGRIKQFIVSGPQGSAPIPGQDGADPAGMLRPTATGYHVIGYRSTTQSITLDSDTFNKYLSMEGLDAILNHRRKHQQNHLPGKEIYSQCAKALLRVGTGALSGYDRTLGFDLELTPQADPAITSGPVTFTLSFHGKPCPGALVMALNRNQPGTIVKQRSNANGEVRLDVGQPGAWLIKAVHMVPAKTATNADWESLWTSLTFERG